MNKHAAALILEEIADLLALRDAERFRVKAYRRAARAVEGLEGDLSTALEEGTLHEVPGLGPGTIGVLRELVRSGRSSLHDRLRAETPAGVVQLRAVSGLGPVRVRALHEQLGIETLEDLREAAEAGRISKVRGLGPATERRILAGIGFVDRSLGRRRQPQALATARRLMGHLEAATGAELHLAGELRRACETVERIELLAVTDDPNAVGRAFVEMPALIGAAAELNADDGSAVVVRAGLADGSGVRLRCATRAAAGAAWIVATGGDAHVRALRERAAARGLRLDAGGLHEGSTRVDAVREEDVYAALDLDWIPPELREGRGELEAAAEGRLPRLVAYEDLRGTFHCHTTFSDGTASVAEMAEAALARGWRYLGIADHSVSARYAGGLTVDEVRRQHEEIDAWNRERGGELRLFKGIEADILHDGRLDYDAEVLGSFEYVVGSVHTGQRMEPEAMTRRLCSAIADPHLTILGHPTGRILLRREPYAFDMEAVMDAAARAGVALEINGDPARLDLDWRHWPRAKGLGIRCAVTPDAHSTAGLGAVVYGIAMARKGWLEPEDVINTWELERVEALFGGA